MNMLGVSRTFIWRTKKVFKETGQITGGLTRNEAISDDTKADQGRRQQDTL
ncbi:Hypothetical protein FKW44_016841 [Caligus rogercresseyi]|uniref:Uncharacterized protein n=1 Tax=Caligus rogercresseyi TaxID=217165 RepID=A0A7T8H390_CALRO|nr:Hypothetical protein FKW44_016841 [Caligus rogercresseyi]